VKDDYPSDCQDLLQVRFYHVSRVGVLPVMR